MWETIEGLQAEKWYKFECIWERLISIIELASDWADAWLLDIHFTWNTLWRHNLSGLFCKWTLLFTLLPTPETRREQELSHIWKQKLLAYLMMPVLTFRSQFSHTTLSGSRPRSLLLTHSFLSHIPTRVGGCFLWPGRSGSSPKLSRWDQAWSSSLPSFPLGEIYNTLISRNSPLSWAWVWLSLSKPVYHSSHRRNTKQRPLYQSIIFYSLYDSDDITLVLPPWRLGKAQRQNHYAMSIFWGWLTTLFPAAGLSLAFSTNPWNWDTTWVHCCQEFLGKCLDSAS